MKKNETGLTKKDWSKPVIISEIPINATLGASNKPGEAGNTAS